MISEAPCPRCGSPEIEAKWILIDQAFVLESDGDPRAICCADLRVDDLLPEARRERPMDQFVAGCYCTACDLGYVPDEMLKPATKRHPSCRHRI